MAVKYKNLALNLRQKVDSTLTWRYILLKKYFPSEKPLIDILFEEKGFFVEILSTEGIFEIISKRISSNYDYSMNIFKFCSG